MKKKSFLKKLSLLTAAVLLFSAMTLGTAAEETYDYDMEYYSQLKDKDVTINVYNWGEYISNGDDDSLDVNAEFEKLTGSVSTTPSLIPTNRCTQSSRAAVQPMMSSSRQIIWFPV